MWPFDNKITLAESGLLKGFTDCHCHILPGVDDGAKTKAEALAILSRYEKLGIRKIWLTPHITERTPHTADELRERLEKFQSTYRGRITLRLSAEYMLDDGFPERLLARDLLPWGNYGNRLLIETPYDNPPDYFYEILESIRSKGRCPILAHPECCLYLNLWDYHTLKEKGTEFQLNLFSLFGAYGKQAKDNATFLLKNNLYEYVGTDLHSLDSLEHALQGELSVKAIEKIRRINFWSH